MELRPGTAGGLDRESTRAVCRHTGGKPALHNAGERLSDCMPRLLRAVSVWTAHRRPVWGGYAAGDGREQSLQRPPVNGREAAWSWASGPGQLHLEPLHGHGLEWRLSLVLV